MPVGNNNQPDRQEPNSGQNQSNNNKSSTTTTYLDELEKIQEKLKKALGDFSEDIDQKRRDIRSQFNEYQKEEKEIAKQKEALQKILLENEKANNELADGQYKDFLETRNKQIQAELTLLEEEEKYAKEKAKFANKEIENEAIRTKIRTQNFEHEQDLERRRLEFQEAHLEKTQAIADKELELQQIKQEYELKGYNSNGKKNSGAEMYKAFGEMKSYFKGNSLGRIVGDSLAGATTKAAKGMSFIAGGKMDVGAMADKMSGALAKAGPYGAAAGGIIQILKTAFEMYSKVNTAASKFAKSAGGGAKAVRDMQHRMAMVADDISHANGEFISFGKRAYDAAKLIDTMAEYSSQLGRNTQYMSKFDVKALQDMKDYGINMDVINQFDTFGIAVEDVSKRLAGVYSKAGQHGLNAKAVTDAVNKNLKMAQNYTFAGGQKALERMAEKAVVLKYNMEAVSRFADKVSTLEGAAQAGANLSVLGGDFARMGNPLSMLYGGLQDPERLNDMMLNMTKNMAHWDSELGEMRISAYNRQRLKAAANAMGVDASDLINQAMTQGKRNIIDNSIGSGVKDDTREFIRNIAKLNDKGQAVVSLKSGAKDANGNDIYQEKLVSELTEKDKKILEAESRSKKLREDATIGDLLEQTMSTQEKLDAILEQIKTKIVMGIFKLYNLIAGSFLFRGEQFDMTTMNMSDEEKEKLKLLERYQSGGNAGLSTEQIEAIKSYGISSQADIRGKSREQLADIIYDGQVEQEEPTKKSYGGVIRGKGTSKSDSIPARLSDGEFVMNAKATSKHLPELKAWNAEGFSNGSGTPIKAGSNQTNSLTVKPTTNQSGYAQQQTSMKVEPITLNITGTSTLKLDLGNGVFKNFDFAKVLKDNIDESFIYELFRKMDFFKNGSINKKHFRNVYST